MKVLVTGAAGLIGSYAIKALHDAGHEVTGLFRRESVEKENFPWRVVAADLTETSSREVLDNVSPDLIVHCAAVLPSQFEGEEARRTAEINKIIDETIIQFCENSGCDLIYTSSTSIYGLKNFLWNETSEVSPVGPYAAAKYETEQSISALNNRSVLLRINSPYAPTQRSRTVLRIFIERAFEGLDLFYFGSGKREQDFTAAEDVARAILQAVNHPSVSGVFNISGGQPISMRNLAELVVKCAKGTKSRVLPSGKADPQENYRALFDIGKAKDILKWRPSISLEDGIVRWLKYLEERNEDRNRI